MSRLIAVAALGLVGLAAHAEAAQAIDREKELVGSWSWHQELDKGAMGGTYAFQADGTYWAGGHLGFYGIGGTGWYVRGRYTLSDGVLTLTPYERGKPLAPNVVQVTWKDKDHISMEWSDGERTDLVRERESTPAKIPR